MMCARFILVVVLLAAAADEEIKSIKDIFNIKTNNEADTNIAVDNQNNDSNQENSGKDDLSKTMKLILFSPYIPELKKSETKLESEYKDTKDLKGKELTKRNGESIDTSTARHPHDHINKREVNQEYTKDVTRPLKGDYSANIDVTSKPYARYEITENVIDIPDDRTPAGPVVHNYSPYRHTPFNLGSPKNNTEVKTETADENNTSSKSRFSILHIKAEIDENPNDNSKIKNFFKGVKNYFSGIKTGVVKGINKLFKHDEAPHAKHFEDSDESQSEELDDDDDDFAELHQTIHKGFR